MSVKIAAKLPQGIRDGIAHIEDRALAKPGETVVAVVVLNHVSTEEHFAGAGTDDDSPDPVVKLAIDSIEALDGIDQSAALSTLKAAYSRRTGEAPLPFGSVFDPETGEVRRNDE